jgi:hypothetical protein
VAVGLQRVEELVAQEGGVHEVGVVGAAAPAISGEIGPARDGDVLGDL